MDHKPLLKTGRNFILMIILILRLLLIIGMAISFLRIETREYGFNFMLLSIVVIIIKTLIISREKVIDKAADIFFGGSFIVLFYIMLIAETKSLQTVFPIGEKRLVILIITYAVLSSLLAYNQEKSKNLLNTMEDAKYDVTIKENTKEQKTLLETDNNQRYMIISGSGRTYYTDWFWVNTSVWIENSISFSGVANTMQANDPENGRRMITLTNFDIIDRSPEKQKRTSKTLRSDREYVASQMGR